jgi:RHS repeat-associated protein
MPWPSTRPSPTEWPARATLSAVEGSDPFAWCTTVPDRCSAARRLERPNSIEISRVASKLKRPFKTSAPRARGASQQRSWFWRGGRRRRTCLAVRGPPRQNYLPFGETLNQSGALPRQRFTGQERDGEAGLDYFNARDLQTRTGRMNAPDPLFGNAMTSPQRWNRYAYVANNPLRMVDPSGMDMVDDQHIQLSVAVFKATTVGYLQQPLPYANWFGGGGGFWGESLPLDWASGQYDGGGGSMSNPGGDGGAGGDAADQTPPARQSPSQTTPGPDAQTDPKVKELAVKTLMSPEVQKIAKKYPYNEIFGAICLNGETGCMFARWEVRAAGEPAMRCLAPSKKVADIHRHTIHGGGWPTPGEGERNMPNFVWTTYGNGSVWQYNQSVYWGATSNTPPGFFPLWWRQ